MGNVTRIEDWKAGSPEALDFSYDALDRLTGVSGAYTASYTYNEIGNITSWDDGTYVWYYYESGKPHAVTTVGVPPWYIKGSYSYDDNGNMTGRTVSGTGYTLTYDAENRLVQVSGAASADFVYDGDGQRVKATVNGTTTLYIGDYYEQEGSTVRKYYYAGGQRVAMRVGSSLYYLLTDHLGSTAITAYSSGGKKAEIRYKAWGEDRYTYGTTPTAYKFTGQRWDATIGLYFYKARYYDPELGRFVQADTIVPGPGNPQALNRYSYVYNNPLRYTDPSGHAIPDDEGNLWRVLPDGSLRLIGLGPGYPHTDRDLTYWTVTQGRRNATNLGVQAMRGTNRIASALWSIDARGAAAWVHAPAALAWANVVRDGARWDFKDRILYELQFSIRLCHAGGCEWFEYSTPGNILYGFTGGAAGFSLAELHAGASVAEMTDPAHEGERNLPGLYVNPNWALTWFDDPTDYAAVEFGYELYQRYGSDVTIREFKALLVDYADRLDRTSAPPPGYQNANWPYVPGYFDGGRR